MADIETLRSKFRENKLEYEFSWVLDFYQNNVVKISECLKRRLTGEPLAYIFGEWPFRELLLKVGPGVLIPRPETEELVEHCLKKLRSLNKKTLRIADLGAGSGCIGIALATELANDYEVEVTFVERSSEAFPYLNTNVQKYALENSSMLNKSWEEVSLSDFDLIVSNPPYISNTEWQSVEAGVADFEPKEALLAGESSDGSECYSQIIANFLTSLSENGFFAFEIGYKQREVFEKLFCDFKLEFYQDIAGHDRVMIVKT